MARRFWLLKCEPETYSIDDLARDGRTTWEGVRNYRARNLLRDEIQLGDGVLFYASSTDPAGVTGLAEVVRAGYPDAFAWKKGHPYFDDCAEFCEKWDQNSIDPNYETKPLEFFAPMVREVFARKAYAPVVIKSGVRVPLTGTPRA